MASLALVPLASRAHAEDNNGGDNQSQQGRPPRPEMMRGEDNNNVRMQLQASTTLRLRLEEQQKKLKDSQEKLQKQRFEMIARASTYAKFSQQHPSSNGDGT
jgi:hypothetical protein